MRKILKQLLIIQEVSNEGRTPKLGKGFFSAKRLNPYHPLSYVALVLAIVAAIICFGIIGAWKELDSRNPFKWY